MTTVEQERRVVSISIPVGMTKRADVIARDLGINRSALFALAIRAFIRSYDKEEEE